MEPAERLGARVRPSQQADRREEVLGQLIDLFLQDGFRALSVEDMARQARCSKRMIYELGDSKEQVVLAVVRGFFRRATDWIAERLEPDAAPEEQIGRYLTLIAEALAPASAQFFADLDAFAPAREIYNQNTRLAAEEVQRMVHAALAGRSRMDASFVGAVAGIVMGAIQRNEVEQATGLKDAEAYRALSTLIVSGVRGQLGGA